MGNCSTLTLILRSILGELLMLNGIQMGTALTRGEARHVFH